MGRANRAGRTSAAPGRQAKRATLGRLSTASGNGQEIAILGNCAFVDIGLEQELGVDAFLTVQLTVHATESSLFGLRNL